VGAKAANQNATMCSFIDHGVGDGVLCVGESEYEQRDCNLEVLWGLCTGVSKTTAFVFVEINGV
jgi:hypothetical protein